MMTAKISCYECEHAIQREGFTKPFFTWCEAPQLVEIFEPDGGYETAPCMVMRNLTVACGFSGKWHQRRDPRHGMRQSYKAETLNAYYRSLHPGQDSECHSLHPPGPYSKQDTGK